MTKDDKEIVSAIRSALVGKVGQNRYDVWFGADTRLNYNAGTLRIGVPNNFYLDWLRSNFRRQLEDACREVCGQCKSLDFRLDNADANQQTGENTQTETTSKTTHPQPALKHAGDGVRLAGAAVIQTAAEKPALRLVAADRNEEPAPLVRRRFASLESFVVGEPNRLAYTSAEIAVRQPGKISPLFVCGPTGVGKTHLLEGIWSAARKSHTRLSTLYLSSEQFTTQFLEALRGSGLPNFRQKYRGVGMLILDDVQFFVGKRATQVELLHTIDAFVREGRQLVFAANRSPADLPELGEELLTRLSSGLICKLDAPDYATRLGILTQMAARMKMKAPADVLQFVAARLTNHARELSGALCRLLATSEATGRPITLAMAEESLSDLIRQSNRAVRLPDIEKAVCEVFGIEPSALQSGQKAQRVSHPRMLAMWLARKHTRAALSEIGNFFGRRSHSTVVAAQKRIDGWVIAGRPIDLADRPCAMGDAIRQVELRLAAG